MKKQNKTNAKYLACFLDFYDEVQRNPKVSVTDFADMYKVGKHPFTIMVQMGILTRTKRGLTWTGKQPNLEMVIQIRMAISQYKQELARKKREQGELFRKSKPNHRIKESVKEWEQRVKQQKAEPTEVYIKQPLPDSSIVSEFINHEPKTHIRESWFRRLIKAIFNIK